MLNPITDKIRKMKSHKKQRSSQTATTPERFLKTRLDHRFKCYSNKQNDELLSNTNKSDTSTPWKNSLLKQRSILTEAPSDKLSHYIKDNRELRQKIKTHEEMEEFYLKELQRQKKQRKDLQWRLSVLSEQLSQHLSPKAEKHKRE